MNKFKKCIIAFCVITSVFLIGCVSVFAEVNSSADMLTLFYNGDDNSGVYEVEFKVNSSTSGTFLAVETSNDDYLDFSYNGSSIEFTSFELDPSPIPGDVLTFTLNDESMSFGDFTSYSVFRAYFDLSGIDYSFDYLKINGVTITPDMARSNNYPTIPNTPGGSVPDSPSDPGSDSNLLGDLGSVFTSTLGWISSIVDVIIDTPILLLTVGFLCLGGIIGLFSRVLGRS